MLIVFVIFFVCVSGLEAPEGCKVPVIEGHLHLTRINVKNQYKRCTLTLPVPTSYIELERYGGRSTDTESWMNFTFVGKPNISVALGVGRLWYGDTYISVPTTTKLEFSMWLQITREEEMLSVSFSPPGAETMTNIFRYAQTFEKNAVVISASSSAGMEQVLQNIQDHPNIAQKSVHIKTIVELERRIVDIERELHGVHKKHKRHSELHGRHFDLHKTQHEKVRVLEQVEPQMTDIQQSVRLWASLSVVIVLVGIYVSWRTYQRQKKERRWKL